VPFARVGKSVTPGGTVPPTAGDRVWDATVRALVESDDGTIQASDVRDRLADPVKRRTVTRHLKALETLGWLDRESDQAHTWHATAKARRYLALE